MLTVFLSFAAPFCKLVCLHYSHLLVVVVLICLVCLPQKFGKEGRRDSAIKARREGRKEGGGCCHAFLLAACSCLAWD